jgi:large subunit ribosomal protein L28
MSRRCELTGVGPLTGHNVSHSNIKTKRRFLPALQTASLQSDALGQTFRLRITNKALRTIDAKGGLDAFIVKAKDDALSLRARRIKKQVKAKLADAAEAAA